jgi:hypothetical protein
MRQGIERRLAPPRLVIDPIDALAWARLSAPLDVDTPEATAARFVTLGAGNRPRPLVRASYRFTARVEPGGDVALPAPIELVTVVNPAGYELFFDVVRTKAGLRRSGLPPARYRLRADAPKYQSAEVEALLAGDEGAAGATRIELSPGDAYPLAVGAPEPPTVVAGALRAADGSGMVFEDAAGAPRRILLIAVQVEVAGQDVEVCAPYSLGGDGRWGLLIDAKKVNFDAAGKAEVELRARDPAAGDLMTIRHVVIERGKSAALMQTRLEGSVRWSDGAPVAGAVVRAATFPGAVRSRPDGEYALYLPPDLDPNLDISVTLAATGPAGATAEMTLDHVTTRTIQRVPPIVLPRP